MVTSAKDFYWRQIDTFGREPETLSNFKEDIDLFLEEDVGSNNHILLKEWILWKAKRLTNNELVILIDYISKLRKYYKWDNYSQILELWAALENINRAWRDVEKTIYRNFEIIWGKIWNYNIISKKIEPIWNWYYKITLKWKKSAWWPTLFWQKITLYKSIEISFIISYNSRLNIFYIQDINWKNEISIYANRKITFKLWWNNITLDVSFIRSGRQRYWKWRK